MGKKKKKNTNPITKKTEKWFALLHQETQNSLNKPYTFKERHRKKRWTGRQTKKGDLNRKPVDTSVSNTAK